MTERETVCYEVSVRATDSTRTQKLIFKIDAFLPKGSKFEDILKIAKENLKKIEERTR